MYIKSYESLSLMLLSALLLHAYGIRANQDCRTCPDYWVCSLHNIHMMYRRMDPEANTKLLLTAYEPHSL